MSDPWREVTNYAGDEQLNILPMIAVGVPVHEVEEWRAQGWFVVPWRSFPHRAYSCIAWRTLTETG